MFSKHPKGLIAAALANLGERFGFYTMMAILVLFLQAKFGLDGKSAGFIYSTFYFSIYILALVGGIIADKTRNYKGTIMVGIVLMALGYLMLAIPSKTPVDNQTLFLAITCIGLFVIAFGNGLFKGNLQALVGQMYDNPQYSCAVSRTVGADTYSRSHRNLYEACFGIIVSACYRSDRFCSRLFERIYYRIPLCFWCCYRGYGSFASHLCIE